MKIVAILPLRLIEKAKLKFPNLLYPVGSDKKQNSQQVKEADSLIAFLDDEAFNEGRSIGTKVEIENNRNKVSSVFRLTGDEWIPIQIPNFTEKLPTWDEYILQDEGNHEPETDLLLKRLNDAKKAVILSPGTCANFKHSIIHECITISNPTKRCGYDSAEDSKTCPLYKPRS